MSKYRKIVVHIKADGCPGAKWHKATKPYVKQAWRSCTETMGLVQRREISKAIVVCEIHGMRCKLRITGVEKGA